jgi:peptidoglycan-N-acetylglucosamine deacetylase
MPGWMIPYRTPFLFPLIYPSLIWRVNGSPKELYLTFDDGPVSGPTDFVLETLRHFSAKATFFCIGDNIRKYPQVFLRIKSEGHAIGNHTFNHLNGWKTAREQYIENVKQCDVEIQKHALGSTRLFRPPYGRITRTEIKALSDYNIIMWDVLTMDFNKEILAEHSLQKAVDATREGSIVVFHDSFKAEKKLNYMLPRFLDHFLQQGYQFKSLPS